MKKLRSLSVFLVFIMLPFMSFADYFDASANGKTIVVHEDGNATLYVVNASTKSKSMIRMGRTSLDWLKMLNDSLVLVHFQSAPLSEVYSIATGKKIYTSDYVLHADKSGNFLFTIAYDPDAKKTALKTFETATLKEIKSTPLSFPEDYITTRLFSLSDDGTKLAALLNKDSKSKLVTFETGSGKLIKEFGSFSIYDTYEMYLNPKGKEKKNIAFLDINNDGSRVVTGNQYKILLYDGTTGKELGTFEENPENQREDFSNTFFSPDNKLIYIGSKYKIYTCNPNSLAAIENIIVDGQKTTYKTIDQYGSTVKKESYFSNEFSWNNVTVSKDNHYIFSICDPSIFNSSGSKEPYFWRFDIIKDGDPYYFTYK